MGVAELGGGFGNEALLNGVHSSAAAPSAEHFGHRPTMEPIVNLCSFRCPPLPQHELQVP
eukprot:6212367-Amphidinium_carterae.1